MTVIYISLLPSINIIVSSCYKEIMCRLIKELTNELIFQDTS